jgi:hypothetical protein
MVIRRVGRQTPGDVHDDGSQTSMYDLRIGAVEAPDVAIECVGAVNS